MDIDRKKIKAYFAARSGWPYVMIGGGALLAITGWFGGVGLIIAAVLLIWGVGLLMRNVSKYSDAEMEAIILDEVSRLQPRALERSQLMEDEIVPPGEGVLIVHGAKTTPTRATVTLTKILKNKKNKGDVIVRSSVLYVACVMFTQQQLVVYSCAYDLLTGNPLEETTQEYFYRDVVGIRVQSQNTAVHTLARPGQMPVGKALQMNALGQERTLEVFELTTTGGTAITIPIPSRSAIRESSAVDQQIQTMRRLLREKKAAIPG